MYMGNPMLAMRGYAAVQPCEDKRTQLFFVRRLPQEVMGGRAEGAAVQGEHVAAVLLD
jgi:hypothetical protein